MSNNGGSAGSVNAAIAAKSVGQMPRKNEDSIEKRKRLQEQGSVLWDRVRECLAKLCSDLNMEYGREVITTHMESAGDMMVRLSIAGSVSKLNATFDAASLSCALKWFYSGPAARTSQDGRCRVYIHNDKVAFQANATPYTPEAIARQMFDGLLSE